jgi:hypothetical protein
MLRESEMRRVLEQAGMADYICDEFDAGAGVAALERLWQSFQSQTLARNTAKSLFWSSDVQASRYLGLLSNVAADD